MKKEKNSAMSPKLSEELEERLRPNRFLGYDRDHLGVALLRRDMLEAAESQFRRAVYLNPFEPGFKLHLAWCLYKMNRFREALDCIEEVRADNPDNEDALLIHQKIIEKMDT